MDELIYVVVSLDHWRIRGFAVVVAVGVGAHAVDPVLAVFRGFHVFEEAQDFWVVSRWLS